jgi:hypothetical protein
MLGALNLRSPVIALLLLAGCGSAASQAQAERRRDAEWCASVVYARGQLEALQRGQTDPDSFGRLAVESWERGTLDDSSFLPVRCR